MPAATNKTDLQNVIRAEFDKLSALIDATDEQTALRKREDDTSIKDVIAHRAHWITLFLGWYRDGQAGKPVNIPAKGYKWSDLKSYNADLRAQQSDLGWQDARAALLSAHAALTGFIDATSDADLYGSPMTGGNNKWTAGRFAEAAGPSHYRSAAKWIRACLRADNAAQ